METSVYQCSRCFRALSDSTHLIDDLDDDSPVIKAVSENVMVGVTNIMEDMEITQFRRKEIKIFCKCGDHLGEMIVKKHPRSKTVDRSYKLLSERIVSYTVGSTLVQGDDQSLTAKTESINVACEKIGDLILRHGERLDLIDQFLTSKTFNQENERPQKRRK